MLLIYQPEYTKGCVTIMALTTRQVESEASSGYRKYLPFQCRAIVGGCKELTKVKKLLNKRFLGHSLWFYATIDPVFNWPLPEEQFTDTQI